MKINLHMKFLERVSTEIYYTNIDIISEIGGLFSSYFMIVGVFSIVGIILYNHNMV